MVMFVKRKGGVVGLLAFAIIQGFILAHGEEIEVEDSGWGAHQGIQAACGLAGIPTDTNAENPYTLPDPVNDNLQINEIAWHFETTGYVEKVTYETTSHSSYLKATFSKPSNYYRMVANEKTKNFVKEQNTREMIRNIYIYCDSTTYVKYYFRIIFQDMTTPVFNEKEYTFYVTSDWNLDRPISDGQFVIVGDNAFELEKDMELRFVPSHDTIRVEAHKLWVLPEQSRYYFRLDLYLTKQLEAGQNIQVILSAFDEFSGGTTIINIRVGA